MENEAEMIRHQMEDTRTALTEKLEALESQVVSTVKGTTEAVAETVDAVKETVQETVEGVKETVQETVEGVTESVSNVKESIKETFDLTGHMERNPWATFGGCVLAGFALGYLLPSASSSKPARRETWSGSGYPEAEPGMTDRLTAGVSSAASSAYDEVSSLASSALAKGWDALKESWGPVADQLKQMAIGTTAGLVGEMVLKSVPPTLKDNVAKMLDDMTVSLGGQIMRSPDGVEAGQTPEGAHTH